MNELTTEIPNEVASLLIPTVMGKPILLPNVSVAEIVPLPEVIVQETTPGWHIGEVPWRGIQIELVSLEALNDEVLQEPNSETHMAVFNGFKDNNKLPFYAVMVQGIPRLVRVYAEEIGKGEGSIGPAQEMHVLINGEPAVIPNLDFIEDQVLSIS